MYKGFLLLFTLFAVSCTHLPTKPERQVLSQEKSLTNRDIKMVVIPEQQSMPAHILFEQKDRYVFGANETSGYKLEASVDPLMRNFFMAAQVQKNGKVVREYGAQKNASAILSDKKNSWSPGRPKMVINIPYLAKGEEVILQTSYEWMDVRWLPPIFLQEDEQGATTSLTLDVAYGVTMHFKASKDHKNFEFMPKNYPQENKLWVDKNNQAGLGLRYVWQSEPENQSKSSIKADQLQLFLAFEAPSRNESQRFESWASVSSYLYNRIDRYDMASHELNDYLALNAKGIESDTNKANFVFNFLKNDIEKRPALGVFNEQTVQPATRTFARKFGSPFDLVILGKAMLSSLGLDSNILLAADSRLNPNINDFYSPALFSSPILSVNTKEGVLYFDPESAKNTSSTLNKNLQGQNALSLKSSKGDLLTLPYDSAQKHGQTLSYQLWINDDDALVGEYSVDLFGFDAEGFSFEPGPIDSQTLENKLRAKTDLPFSLASAELLSNSSNSTLRFFGEIKPSLLNKTDGQSSLKLEKIVEPVISQIRSAKDRGYSFTSKIAMVLSLPDRFVAKNMPENVNVEADGINARFFVSNPGHELIVEAMALVSFPISQTTAKLDEGLKNIASFSEKSLSIGEDYAQGDSHVAQPPLSKNP